MQGPADLRLLAGIQAHARRRRGRVGRDTARAFEHRRGAVVFEQVDQRERHVARTLGQRSRRALARFGHRFGFLRRARGQLAQRAQTAFAQDALGFFRDHAQHAAHAAVVGRNGAVGERVVGLFRKAVAFEEQQQALVPGRIAGGDHLLRARADVRPDLGPHFARGTPQRPGMLRTQRHAGVRVVVEEGEVGAPAEPHGVAAVEHDAQRDAQTARPGGHRPQRRARPVELADQAAGFAAAPGRRFRAISIGRVDHACEPSRLCQSGRKHTDAHWSRQPVGASNSRLAPPCKKQRRPL
jgi:hypothetical protein